MSKRKIAINLKNVSKRYILHHEKPTLVENLIGRGYKEEYIAIDNVNLEICEGENVGIIGHNGAGKTTLLKIISGITTPNAGVVKTKGRIVSLIDLEAGFHPDLTGEENIFLNSLLIGMSEEEIQSQFNNIVNFADIGHFIDAPLYTYSQGMKLRVSFSIAIHANPDIIILDEIFNVGDEEFQRKINSKIENLFELNKTILVVSHWIDYLRKHTKRIIWLNNGAIMADGGHEILDQYIER